MTNIRQAPATPSGLFRDAMSTDTLAAPLVSAGFDINAQFHTLLQGRTAACRVMKVRPKHCNPESNRQLRPRRPIRPIQLWIWARLVAVIVFVVLVPAVFFFAGFFTREHYGDHHYREDVVPGEAACVQPECHPMGRGGQHCYYRPVPWLRVVAYHPST